MSKFYLCPNCDGNCGDGAVCPWLTWEYGPSSLSEPFTPSEQDIAEDPDMKPSYNKLTYNVVCNFSESVSFETINDSIDFANKMVDNGNNDNVSIWFQREHLGVWVADSPTCGMFEPVNEIDLPF